MLEQAQIVTSSDPSIIQVTAAAEPAPAAQNQEEESPQRRSLWKMVLTIIALGAMSGLFLFFPIDWDSIGNWGYLGVFLVQVALVLYYSDNRLRDLRICLPVWPLVMLVIVPINSRGWPYSYSLKVAARRQIDNCPRISSRD